MKAIFLAAAAAFSLYRPSTGDGEARSNHSVQERLPTRTRRSCLFAGLRLLESVIDRHGKPGVRLLGEFAGTPRAERLLLRIAERGRYSAVAPIGHSRAETKSMESK